VLLHRHGGVVSGAWLERHGCWTCGAWTVRIDLNPRTGITLFELFDHTRFVRTFASAQAARAYADCASAANDNRRASV
jgi:hypothetical protein